MTDTQLVDDTEALERRLAIRARVRQLAEAAAEVKVHKLELQKQIRADAVEQARRQQIAQLAAAQAVEPRAQQTGVPYDVRICMKTG